MKEPPEGYEGQRVGDYAVYKGKEYVVIALIYNPAHMCERGDLCKARWLTRLKSTDFGKEPTKGRGNPRPL